ncbi:MAG: hypothetical protein HFI76_08230 [Lachnospiraceae bacterium]|nr:hypothetical protein [Lachnospiraceae bacterium]
MLGKLIKHDFKSTSKVMIPISFAFVAITLLGVLFLGTKLMQREELLPLTITLLVAYILTLVTLTMVTQIYLIVHFYRNMFSAQGYLTFTLPSSPQKIFHSKMLVGCAWMLLISVLSVVSALVLIGVASGFENISSIIQEICSMELFTAGDLDAHFSASLTDVMGYTSGQLVLLTVILTLVSIYYNISIGFGSVTIGQLYAKHKVVGAVLVYVGFYLLMQILSTITIFFICLRPVLDILATPEGELEGMAFIQMMRSIYQPMFPSMILTQLGAGILCHIASILIVNKKVNLD